MKIFNRLFLKVYLTVIGTLLLAALVTAAVWRAGPEMETARGAFELASGVAAAALADPGSPPASQQKAVDRLARLLKADLALYDSHERLIASSGASMPPPSEIGDREDLRHMSHTHGPVWSFHVSDGRIIVVRPPLGHHRRGPAFIFHLLVIALVLAIGSFPVVRGLTLRLERLQQGVETFGAGDLSVRIKVEGHDEVARVAESFNRAATRIEGLVDAHRMLLANASHELRTPLTRLRLGIERLKHQADADTRNGLELDIAELDQLIEEILLSSRLDAIGKPETLPESLEDIDLLALAAEEASRFDDIAVSGTPVMLRGDPRLLRRLIRNLIDNATRHGRPPVEVSVTAEGREVRLEVADHGPGVTAAEATRIFEPFYKNPANGTHERSTGLGLALVRQIARHHSGDVRVVGANRFVVTLPKTSSHS